eukprot:3010794-Rhodomonas_salina.4
MRTWQQSPSKPKVYTTPNHTTIHNTQAHVPQQTQTCARRSSHLARVAVEAKGALARANHQPAPLVPQPALAVARTRSRATLDLRGNPSHSLAISACCVNSDRFWGLGFAVWALGFGGFAVRGCRVSESGYRFRGLKDRHARRFRV